MTRNLSGVGRSLIVAHQVQAQIDTGAGTGARGDVSMVDVQHVGIDLDAREARLEFGCPCPVGGRTSTVEQSGLATCPGFSVQTVNS